jgi:S-formylglutathione hydrolase FrmB
MWWLLEGLFSRGGHTRHLDRRSIRSSALEKEMPYAVLHPPVSGRALPVAYLLHGMGSDHLALDKFGLSERYQHAMADGALPPAYLVAPNGERGFFINWHDGSHRYEDHIVEEVIPEAERYLGLGDLPRERRLIIGASMGGIGALQIGLRHPDLFASVGCVSGLIPNEEQADRFLNGSFIRHFVDLERIFGQVTDRAFFESHNPYCIVDRRAPDLGQRLFLAVASGDRPQIRQTSTQFHRFLIDRGVDHHWVEFDGAHAWRHWGPVFEQAILYGLQTAEATPQR